MSDTHSTLLACLAQLARSGEDYDLEMKVNGIAVRVSVVHSSPPPPTQGEPLKERGYSHLERRLLTAIGEEWISAERVAEKVGERCGEGLRAVLGNLTELAVLESAPGRGYRRPAT